MSCLLIPLQSHSSQGRATRGRTSGLARLPPSVSKTVLKAAWRSTTCSQARRSCDVQDLPELADELLDKDAIPRRRNLMQQHSQLHRREGISKVHWPNGASFNNGANGKSAH